MNQPPPFAAPPGPPQPGGPGPVGFGYPPGSPPGPPPTAPRKTSGAVIIVIVIFGVVTLCGVFAALGVHGFRRYLERAKEAAAQDGGAPLGGGDDGGPSGGSAEPQPLAGRTARSADGKTEIALPEPWQELKELNDDASIQIGSSSLDEYLMVISESKEDFAAGMTLDRFAEINLGHMKSKVVGAEITPTQSVTIQGRPARQAEVRGSVDLLNVAYLVTYVDGGRQYHQVIAWTRKSKFDECRPRFAATAASLRER